MADLYTITDLHLSLADMTRKPLFGLAPRLDILKGLSFSIEKGAVLGIVGGSGSGKSTLGRALVRLLEPSGGRVVFDGADITHLSDAELRPLRRRFQMIFQDPMSSLNPRHRVGTIIAEPLRLHGFDGIAARVLRALDHVGLPKDFAQRYPHELSGGQRQRVGIARALVHRPEILLCDEATSALDPESTQAILALLRDIHRQLGLTIVLITHEMAVIREICQQVLVLEQGQAVEQGPIWQVFGAPRHEATRALLAPLAQRLPTELQQRLRLKPPTATASASAADTPRFDRLVELTYTGETDLLPDWRRLAEVLQGAPRLLHGGIEQLQGHAHGRLVLAIEGIGPGAQAVLKHQLSHQAKDLGYVEHPL